MDACVEENIFLAPEIKTKLFGIAHRFSMPEQPNEKKNKGRTEESKRKKKLALKSWWAEIQSQSDWVNLCRHNMLYDYVTNLANKYKVFFGAQNRFENIWWKW